jgi:hypothetical protein
LFQDSNSCIQMPDRRKQSPHYIEDMKKIPPASMFL